MSAPANDATPCQCCETALVDSLPAKDRQTAMLDLELRGVERVAAFIAGAAAACNGVTLQEALCETHAKMAEEALAFTRTPWPPVAP